MVPYDRILDFMFAKRLSYVDGSNYAIKIEFE